MNIQYIQLLQTINLEGCVRINITDTNHGLILMSKLKTFCEGIDFDLYKNCSGNLILNVFNKND